MQMRAHLTIYAIVSVVAQSAAVLAIQFLGNSVGVFWSHYLEGMRMPFLTRLLVANYSWAICLPLSCLGMFILCKLLRLSDSVVLHVLCVSLLITVGTLSLAGIGAALPLKKAFNYHRGQSSSGSSLTMPSQDAILDPRK
jgi:hypothetical protein